MKKTNCTTNIIPNILAFIAIVISGVSLYFTLSPDNTKLTIQKSQLKGCMSNQPKCYQLFIYNNDRAPCFELNIHFNKKDFEKVYFITNYKDSNLFNLSSNKTHIQFPAMKNVIMNNSWLGYLDKKEIASFAFFPQKNNTDKKKVKISCLDYEETIVF